MPSGELPEWDLLLSSASRLQKILPSAVLVGGSAAALHARHRFSRDADHVLPDLTPRFDKILAEIESVAGWRTARVRRPVMILGSLDGIETGIRQLIRDQRQRVGRQEDGGRPGLPGKQPVHQHPHPVRVRLQEVFGSIEQRHILELQAAAAASTPCKTSR